MPLWRVFLAAADSAAAEAAATALDGMLESLSVFESASDGQWQIEGLSRRRPDVAALETRLALVWPAAEVPALGLEPLTPRDWLGENQVAFPPLKVGRFFIHGAHLGRRPAACIALRIDAATAFGTGEHATTRGCLLALDRLARRRRCRRVLDMGTGTGILAIAAAKTWHRRVLARDIDGEAVRVARLNARLNGVGPRLGVARSAGYRDRRLDRAKPFDLVFANILARPLQQMARDLRRILAADGMAVLSGLLARQERAVLAAHRRQHLRLYQSISIGGWRTLVIAGGRAGPAASPLSISHRSISHEHP